MSSLHGKRALVTGASRGIGSAIALRLAREGADVAFSFNQSSEKASSIVDQIQALGRRSFAFKADNAESGAIADLVDNAEQKLGGLDILVNNAGIVLTGEPDRITEAEVDLIYAVNVRATILASIAALRHLPRGGRIVSIGSSLADRVTDPGLSLYASTKAALVAWTKGLARDLGPREITVNIVHPGSTETDMNPSDGASSALQRSRMAIPRYGTADDVAALVSFVVGPEGSSINGTSLSIDGGTNA